MEREGFFARLNKEYRLELDETGRLEVLDTQGKRIPSTKQAHAFKSYEEVLEEQGRALGVWAENPQAGKPAGRVPSNFVPAPGASPSLPVAVPGDGGRVRKLSGRLVKR